MDATMHAEPTLTQALAARGYTSRKGFGDSYRRIIMCDVEEVGAFSASEGWAWLAAGCPRSAAGIDAAMASVYGGAR